MALLKVRWFPALLNAPEIPCTLEAVTLHLLNSFRKEDTAAII